MKKLAQLKLDAKNSGWPWPIDHPNDERALIEGCYVDFEAAERVREFYNDLLILPREGGGTRPFELLQFWYRDILAPLFGWKRPDGRRRFDKGFITTGKKNAKSTTLAGLALYMTVGDREPEAEVYLTAVDRDQASIMYNKVSRAVKESRHLSKIIKPRDSQKFMTGPDASRLEAISSDADSTEGKNPHLVVMDELHVWKDRTYFESLMYGDIVRTQPLLLMITTAGNNLACVGYEEYEFAKTLLNPDDEFYSQSHFAFIAEAGDDREWDDPDGWVEANPAILEGVGSIEKLKAKCEEARQSPGKQQSFRRYICNRWTSEIENPWLDIGAWYACGTGTHVTHGPECFFELNPSSPLDCFVGLDLSRNRDLTSACLAFQVGNDIHLSWLYWLPEDRIKQLTRGDRILHEKWIADGWLTTTPGDVVDYAYIRRAISGVVVDEQGNTTSEKWDGAIAQQYSIQELAYDPYNATKLVTELRDYDGIECVEFRQGIAHMNAPSKEFDRLIGERTIVHDNNPVSDWCVSNVVTDEDPSGNIRPSKKKSRNKIDGVVTAIMAIARLQFRSRESSSAYENRGIITIWRCCGTVAWLLVFVWWCTARGNLARHWRG